MFTTFDEAIRHLYSIPADFPTHGAFKFARGRYFARLCGDVQNSIPSIHVAGTSGKGSTSWIAHRLLLGQGYRAGLHVSPHTLDYRERMMTGPELMSESAFLGHLNAFMPLTDAMTASPYGRPSYTEVSTMLAWHAFAREELDVAVVEVACGGLHDATNILDREDTIRVITEIGYDHTHWLGETLREIMYQKAGIIHRGNRVISLRKDDEIQPILSAVCETEGGDGYFPNAEDVLTVRSVSAEGTVFDIHDDLHDERGIVLGMIGAYQARNAYLAIRAVSEWMARQGRALDWVAARRTLAETRMAGRFDRIALGESTTLVIDGAHNPQKMTAFVRALRDVYPDTPVDALLGFKEGKNYQEMLSIILPEVRSVALAGFDIGSDSIHSENLAHLRSLVAGMGELDPRIVEDVRAELDAMRSYRGPHRVVAATGSLYFISTIYPLLADMGLVGRP